jgi:dihydrofolate reductase
MSTQVTVTLPDEVYRSAVRLAQLARREVADVLTDTLTLSLPSLHQDSDVLPPIETLSDADILTLTALELPPAQDRRLSAATKYVITHRPESLEWGPFEGLGSAIVEGIRRITSQDGPNLMLLGSSTLTSTLLEHGLADEVLLFVYPVLLGTGKRFFAQGTRACSLELANTKAMPSGIILSTYTVAGPLKTG